MCTSSIVIDSRWYNSVEKKIADMRKPIYKLCVALLNKNMYIFGGLTNDENTWNSGQRLEIQMDYHDLSMARICNIVSDPVMPVGVSSAKAVAFGILTLYMPRTSM